MKAANSEKMKNSLSTLFLVLFLNNTYSQISNYAYPGGRPSDVTKQTLKSAKFIGEIIADYPTLYYSSIIDYLSVEISVTASGEILTAKHRSDTLSIEQKNILMLADMSSDVNIKIKFQYKDPSDSIRGGGNRFKEMKHSILIVPETEAEYPGGYEQITNYLKEHVSDKIIPASPPEKLGIVTVSFTINENGDVTDSKIEKSSGDVKVDKLLLDAINKMPKWKAAENEKGMKIKQTFKISFPRMGGC